jgi:hypothetical protein
LKNGKISVSFEWAPRLGMDVRQNGLSIKLNGKVLKEFAATDMKLRKENLEFTVTDLPEKSLF